TTKVHPRSQSVFWCRDEELDSVFTDWTIFTGLIKSGQKKEQPRQLARLSRNSACLLTSRDPDTPETERRILGAFMVHENISVRRCADGYIPAHSKYRLRLSEEESAKMLFWNYYINRKYPHKMTWNTGRHRYFDNIWMAQILLDILSLKTEPRERESVEAFLKYLCQTNLIEKGDLPKPEGALILNKTPSKTKK
ncbi:MAG: malate synthase, partial [Firmicutes bacterium]|nr:malate synthase [Bacillota bacterium]